MGIWKASVALSMVERFCKENSKFVYVRMSGDVSDKQIRDHIVAYNRECQGREGLLELADTRQVSDISEMTVNALMSSVDLEKKHSRIKGGKLVIIVSDNLSYGMSRVYSSVSEVQGRETNVFSTLDKAVKWLVLDKDVDATIRFLELLAQ